MSDDLQLSLYLTSPGLDKTLLQNAFGALGLIRTDTNQSFSDAEKAMARANIGADRAPSSTQVENEDKIIAPSDRILATISSFTAPHTWTLPLANSVPAGSMIVINDSFGAVSSTNTLTVQAAGSDTLQPGAHTSTVIAIPGSHLELISDGVSKWGVEWVNSDFVVFGNKLPGNANLTLTNRISENQKRINALEFGVDPTGTNDSTAALVAFYAALQPGMIGELPPGTIKFNTALTWAGKDRIVIKGAGRGITKLVYTGANTTNDLIVFGDYLDTYIDNQFLDFTVSSNTLMTGGYALRFKGLSSSIVARVSMDGQYGLGNLWHGIYFDGVQVCRYEDYETYCQRDGASVSGTVGVGPKALMHFKEGWMLGTSSANSVGIRVGGAFGGVYIDAIDCSGAMFAATVVDETLKAEPNREVFFWNADFDAGHTYSVLILHSNGQPGVYVYDGCYFFSPVRIQTGTGSNHKFSGCTFSPNLGGDALRVDTDSFVFATGCFFLPQSSGYAVNITSPTHGVTLPQGSNHVGNGGLGAFSTYRPRDEYFSFLDMASASTTDIASRAEKSINITGTTTITAFGNAPQGVRKLLKFAGALTLTHNATSLILQAGANVTTSAGMLMEFVSLGGGNWAQAAPNSIIGFDSVHTVGTSIASSATVNLDTATGYKVLLTGTTGVTAITLAAGKLRVVTCAAAVKFTNGASLVLPGGVDFYAEAGDVLIFAGTSVGTQCIGYTRAGQGYTESIVASASPVALTTGSAKTWAHFDLGPGEYDVSANLAASLSGSANVTRFLCSISLADNAVDITPGRFSEAWLPPAGIAPTGVSPGANVPSVRIVLTATTTIYAVALSAFSVGSVSAWGILRARRVR